MIYCFFFCYISINCLISGVSPRFIICHPTPIDSIIRRRLQGLAFFVCYISINCLYQWSVPKMYYISSNADCSDSRFSFVIYQSTACSGVECTQNVLYIIQRRSEWLALFVCYISINCLYSGVYPKCIIYHPTPIGVTRAFCLLYHSTACSGVECTQNLLYIIQRRSERLALFVCYISINCLYSGVYPKCIVYHPTPIGATRAFRLLYINQLPVVEWSVTKIYYISSNADRSNSRFSFVIYQSTACIVEWSVPKMYYISSNADRSDSRFSFVISFNCL
jgi:hypothetical protein